MIINYQIHTLSKSHAEVIGSEPLEHGEHLAHEALVESKHKLLQPSWTKDCNLSLRTAHRTVDHLQERTSSQARMKQATNVSIGTPPLK